MYCLLNLVQNTKKIICKILKIPNLCSFFLWLWWLLRYKQLCNFSLHKSNTSYLGPVLPASILSTTKLIHLFHQKLFNLFSRTDRHTGTHALTFIPFLTSLRSLNSWSQMSNKNVTISLYVNLTLLYLINCLRQFLDGESSVT